MPEKIIHTEGEPNTSAARADWASKETNTATNTLLQRDSDAFLHQALFSPCVSTIARAEGIWIEDTSGRRKQELLGLEWDRVDFRRDVITLNACHTKTKKRRTVPINDDARAALIKRARFRAEHCPDSPWVFCNKEGDRIGDMRTAFNRACSKVGITDFTMHDLRHTCASWLVMAGRPILEVREMLGHASVTMTERYAHLAPDKLQDAARTLESKPHSGHTDFFVTKKPSGQCS